MGNFHNKTLLFLYCLVLIEQIQIQCSAKADSNVSCHHSERDALLKFKVCLIDESNRLSTWSGENCCKWDGVGCSAITNHVVRLDLHNQFPFDSLRYSEDANYASSYSNSCLGGELNPSLLKLKHLQYLDLSMNNFSGIQIPMFIGSMKTLRYLDLNSAGFHGMIPDHLGNLSSLQYLHLGDAPLGWSYGSGYILSSRNLRWVSKLGSLKILDLSGVYLGETRVWLDAINMLSTLESLSLAGCGLNSIPFPPHINLTSVTTLDLQGNSFNSTIPLWLFNLTSVKNLHLAGNLFHGSIPNDISRLKSLNVLDLFSNDLTNSLPNSLCNVTILSYVYLHFNQFQGSLPRCLGKLTNLIEFNVNFNKIFGTVPTGLGQLANLERLVLANNPLTGVLSEVHFLTLTKLRALRVRSTLLSWNVSITWIPPFQLQFIDISYTKVGPKFPSWLQSQKDVETLRMSDASISDVIPDWFEIVYSQINYIDLTDNQITGQIPEFQETKGFYRCIALYFNKFEGPLKSFPVDAVVYDVSRNSLRGGIPQFHPNTTTLNIQYLTLNDNHLTGSIPDYICNLQTLQFIDFSNNQLSGRVPSCLGNLQNLNMLNLGNNSFSGQIPGTLGNMEFLIFLHLNENKFYGELPPSLQNLQNLEVIDLGGNRLEGTIPRWIGEKLSSLRILRLHSNNFFGAISLRLCLLSNLQVLNLEENKLSGNIPRCFSNFSAMVSEDYSPFSFITTHPSKVSNFMKGRELEYTSNLPFLRSLGLSENNLMGEIPEELMNLVGLQGLNLSRNYLSGRIPEKIGSLNQLESLDLSRNELSGHIPQSLSVLTSLSFLNLSFNKLTGPIPSGDQLQTLDDPSIYVGNNGLCGKPLPNLCPDPSKSPVQEGSASDRANEKVSTILWFLGGLGPGFAVGLLGFFSILVFKKSWSHSYSQILENIFESITQ